MATPSLDIVPSARKVHTRFQGGAYEGEDHMDVTLLGTNGWMPRGSRETTCFAVRSGTTLVVFDAGTGLRRLLDPEHAGLLEGAGEVQLFLSHYHLDHVCGLAYLSGVLPGRDVVLRPPAEEMTGVDPYAAVAELVRRPYNPTDLADMKNVRVEPARRGENEVGGHTLRVRPQQHTDTSVSFRLDDELVIATDTKVDPDSVEFAAGAGLWLHESWYWAGDPALDDMPEGLRAGYAAHSEATGVAGLAAEAGVGRLILVHLNPIAGEASLAPMRAAAQSVFGNTDIVEDGTVARTSAV
jgi:ribonuclease BN (tRNA processing enzyme)